jgi:hypothetical protein
MPRSSPLVVSSLGVAACYAGYQGLNAVFVSPGGRPAVAQAPALRGASPASATLGSVEEGTCLGVWAPLGIAAVGFAVARRQQRAPAVSCRNAKSYKEYTDPWLGSADFGFDPLNVAVGSVFDKGDSVVPETTYYNYRESEVKHGRFAMAAFLAIFGEEADRGALLQQLGVSGAMDNLDGTLGLDEVQAPLLIVGLGAQALAEFSKQSKENDGDFRTVEYQKDRCPGDLGFDPLGFGVGNTTTQKVELHNTEVNLGRLAMIGVTSFIFKEFIVKDPTIAAKIL